MKTLLTLICAALFGILIALGGIWHTTIYGGAFALVYTMNGQDYIIDHGMSYDDCIFRTASDNLRCVQQP